MANSERPRLAPLDGLRGILALVVVLYHLPYSFPTLAGWLDANIPMRRNGSFAVDVFFVLSGFVMMYVYATHFSEGVGIANYLKFFRARIARLYPVHIVTMLVLGICLSRYLLRTPEAMDPDGLYSLNAAFASLFMLHGPWIDHRTWNYPSWSISLEFHAYAIFPFLVAWVRGKYRSICLVVVGVIVPLVIYLISRGEVSPYPTNGMLSLARSIALFIAGMATYNLWHEPLFDRSWLAPSIFVGLLVCLGVTSLNIFSVLFVPALVLVTLRNATTSRIFSTRLALFLGGISYSLYMIHAVVQLPFLGRIKTLFPDISVPTQAGLVLLFTGISIFAAHLLKKYVEDPGRKWINGRSVLIEKPASI